MLLAAALPIGLSSTGCAGTADVDDPSAGGASAGAGGASAGAALCSRAELMPASGCGPFTVSVPLSCIDTARATATTSFADPHCSEICGHPGSYCTVNTVTAQAVSLSCASYCGAGGGGRRPAGLQSEPAETAGLGGYFAELAHLEAASINAFRMLRDELHLHGAPKRLVRAAGRAARDETRHARATAALARRFGANPVQARVAPHTPKSLEAMAIDNAAEGCVRETFGALLATWQARTASNPLVRAAMARIARDETRHAALSWSVARWLDTRLSSESRRRVEIARQHAVRDVLDNANGPSAGFADAAGLPGAEVAAQLAQEMQRALWS
jgi:hypothetical protein